MCYFNLIVKNNFRTNIFRRFVRKNINVYISILLYEDFLAVQVY